MDLTELLGQANQPGEQQKAAEVQLLTLKQQNFPAFVFSLAQELANEQKQPTTRSLAGILLKNQMESRDEAQKEKNFEQWIALQAEVKEQIKQLLLKTLFTEVKEVRRAGSQVVAIIAAIELPRKEWPALIPFLLKNADSPDISSGIKQSCLETLGYVCEELGNVDNVFEQQEVNNILTAVVSGMRKDSDNDLRYAATNALYNALDFARVNFDTEQERTYLMQVICEGTQCPEEKVRKVSFECLVRIASTYYDKLTAYMNEIYAITIKASKFDVEDVGLQAIEFWCTVAEEELDIMLDQDEGSSDRINHNFIQTARQTLVPLLLELLMRQEEGQESDDTTWNMSMAAGTCLGLVAQAVQDEIVDQVMSFVEGNIAKKQNPEDWRNREAATFAFGSILEGPTQQKLGPFVLAALPFLKSALEDDNAAVRNTTAWTIGRVFEFLHGPETKLINQTNLEPLMGALLTAIKGEPHVAEKICYAISKLASGFPISSDTTLMSQYTQPLIQTLLETTDRQVPFGQKLQGSAYEAFNQVVTYTADDQLELVASLIDVILSRIGMVLSNPAHGRNQQEQTETLGKLCAALQVIVNRLRAADSYRSVLKERYADTLMQVLIQIQHRQDQLDRSTVQEEAILCIGSLTYICEADFLRYMNSLYPSIEQGLKNFQEIQVCEITVGLVGDIARCIGSDIARYTDGIM